MGWKRVEFTADALARNLPKALTEAFETDFLAAGAPGNAALFESRVGGRLHFHFSPGAAALFEKTLSTLGPKRGSAPGTGARLLVGNPQMWAPEKGAAG
jgi:hypothetical protein